MGAFRIMGLKNNRQEMEALMVQSAPDGSGAIDFDHFASIMASSLQLEGRPDGADQVNGDSW